MGEERRSDESFNTTVLGLKADAIAPDGSEVRILTQTSRGSMAHFALPPHAVSKAADTGPWLLRTGFRVLGRTNQLRFYRQICRRVRRLTEATLEARRVAAAA